MLLGDFYTNKMPLEIFLRTMDVQVYNLKDIRKKYYFISEDEFCKIISICLQKGIISVREQQGTVLFSQKYYDVIKFIEQYDFVNVVSSIVASKKFVCQNPNLKKLLQQTSFVARFAQDNCDLGDELNKCLKYLHKADYSLEISNLNLFVRGNANG